MAEMKFADGALLLVLDFKNVDTAVWPGMRISSPKRVVHVWTKEGKGTDHSTLCDLALRLTSNVKPPSFV